VDFNAFLDALRSSPEYRGQIVFSHEEPPRAARYGPLPERLGPAARTMLAALGRNKLYTHQSHAVAAALDGRNVVVATGPASGKSLCYVTPIVDALSRDPEATALLLFPTKALCQDQFRGMAEALEAAGLGKTLAGVVDGDSPPSLRRRLRDHGAVVLSNPDMLHAGILPQHEQWARFLGRLRYLVLDELHVYSGVFGSNMANLMRRFFRICRRHGSDPQVMACSATIASPRDLATGLVGKPFTLAGDDGAPKGRRTYVIWNPPRIRDGAWRSRRSANVEAHELMAKLLMAGAPTIVFTKARMTAEMLCRYVREKLLAEAPPLAAKVCAYRGGYRPQDRRKLESRLFKGELMGVSATRALELGIDVGALDACIVVGYPGTRASFFQQTGRAGRQGRDALAVLVTVDTAINQYVASQPAYVFGQPVEEAVLEADNPFIITGHLRCAAQEMALSDEDARLFGPHALMALRVLEDNLKVRRIKGRWHHAAAETPQHEISLRAMVPANVLISDADSGQVLGEVDQFDAPPLLHPDAIYMIQGDTYRVLSLDLDRNLAVVQRVNVDYYTQPIGGADVHHVDHCLREKPFGSGRAFWGEVTAYFQTRMYEKIHFYSLDAVSRHGLDLPVLSLETQAVWIVPPDLLMEQVRRAGLDAHSGLRGIGYALRMALPLFMTCDTLDFSHSVGSANSPWSALFVYERYPLGLGFTQKAYERLGEVMRAVWKRVADCDCGDGCPCCVGKPLRQDTTWNIERGEGSIPSRRSALMILEGLMGDGSRLDEPDTGTLASDAAGQEARLEQALRRRLERMREPQVFHPIEPVVKTGYPERAKPAELSQPDAVARAERRVDFERDQRRRLSKKLQSAKLDPFARRAGPPPGMVTPEGSRRPIDFPGQPLPGAAEAAKKGAPPRPPAPPAQPLVLGDSLAARARRLKRDRDRGAAP